MTAETQSPQEFETFRFNVQPCSEQHLQQVAATVGSLQKNTNGLVRLLHLGYSQHVPVVIRPDDVLNTVGCVWAKYVLVHAERFRNQFVAHAGKKELEYEAGGTYHDSRLPEFFDGLLQLVKSDQQNDKLGWLTGFQSAVSTAADFTTRAAVALASQKKYYDFRISLCCGFPEVCLAGSRNDWEDLLGRLSQMPALDDELGQWQERLLQTVPGMLSGEEDFWQRCVTNEAFGSGPRDFDGWILDFNPFDEKGRRLKRMEDYDMLNLTVDFEVDVNDNGREFKLLVEAGPDAVRLEEGRLLAGASLRHEILTTA